jgi:hypothetical protein
MVQMIAKSQRILLVGVVAFLTSMGLLAGCGQPSSQEESDNPQNVQENEVDQDDNPNAPGQNGDNDDQDSDRQGQDDNDDDNDNDKDGD